MFQGWRFQLREAEEALEQGRLEEARRLLEGDLRLYLPGQRLARKLAVQLGERARRRVDRGDFAAAWRDWEQARAIAGETDELLAVKHELLEIFGSEVERYLRAAQPERVFSLLELLARRGVTSDALRHAKAVARRLDSAAQLAQHGRFADAEQQLQAAAELRPDVEVIGRLRSEYRQKATESRELQQQLHRAMAADQWSQVVALADRMQELAPQNRLAADARKRAWLEVGAEIDSARDHLAASAEGTSATSRAAGTAVCEARDEARDMGTGERFLLWVDAVGGFLVCLGDDVTIGQAVPDNGVEVPVLADISRRHARICRRGDGYVIEPLQQVAVAGGRIKETTLLTDGDEIELGQGVRLRFRQPHVLSATARLEFLSRHRTFPSADAVLLMAESCVLGPQTQNHVVCRDWATDAVLFRQDDQLYCRCLDWLEIDGRVCEGRGEVSRSSRISGEDFSMSLEPL